MKLILKSLKITNFKGIASLLLSFNEKENFVFGRNGAGKTTISDAYHWLMTGKDSADSKDFEIKPIDTNGDRAQKIDNEIEGVFDVDGEEITLKKVHSEKWVKPKGQIEAEFKGNETTYFWNGGPITMKDYQAKLESIISDSKLKLFSNTDYFNGLKWNERRAVLIEMSGGADKHAIIASDKNFAFIGELLTQRKSFEEFKKQIANDKKRAKDEVILIPSRIDEVKRNSSSLERPFGRLKTELQKHQSELSGIEAAISDKQEAYKLQDEKAQQIRKQKYELEVTASNIKDALAIGINSASNAPDEGKLKLQQELTGLQNRLKTIQDGHSFLKTRIANGAEKVNATTKEVYTLKDEVANLKTQWLSENEKRLEFDENDFHCPTCKRAFEESDIFSKQEELKAAFNNNKKTTLENLVTKADEKKTKISTLTAEIEQYKTAITELSNQQNQEQISVDELSVNVSSFQLQIHNYNDSKQESGISKETQLQIALEEHVEYNELVRNINMLGEELSTFKHVDNAVLIARKNELLPAIDELNKDLLNEQIIKNNANRIVELEVQEKELSQAIADLEKKEFYMLQFNLKQSEEVENAVNKMFSFVQFRLFDTQINGEVIEACKTLVNGCPIEGNAVNTAARINAGVDIINTLSNHYNIHVPMFIDGRESVTDLISTESQIINLIVSPFHEKLTLSESLHEMAAA